MPRATTLALVGVHGYGTVHLDNLRRIGDRVRLVAVADPRPPEPGVLPEHTRVFADLPSLLAETDDIDVVIVATPLHTHLELARSVVDRGIDLYLEKPPVLTLADLRVLEEACARSGARVQVGFQSLGSRALAAFAENRFDLGPIRAIGAVGLWARDRAYWERSRWAGRRELDGRPVVDGVTTNPLAHATATALALAGTTARADITQVTADLYRANAIEGDDTSLLRLSTTRGIRITAGLTLCADDQVDPYVEVHGRRRSARFFYTEDVVEIDGRTERFERDDLLENLLDHRDHGTPLLSPLAASGAFVAVIDAVGRTTPHEIDPAFVTPRGEGPARRLVVVGIEDAVRRAVDAEATFGELHLPWARTTPPPTIATLAGPDAPLAELVDGTGTARSSSPRPYLHPVRTPGGVVVTDHHPVDHDWHLGVSVTLQDVDGVNFWGGRTYTPGEDYIWRGDHGRIDVERVEHLADGVELDLRWIGPDGALVLREHREMRVSYRDDRAAVMTLTFSLSPVGDRTVLLGGPGSNGRVGGGYGGLAWRLPACTEVDVRTPHARGEEAVHGSVAPWLAWSARFVAGAGAGAGAGGDAAPGATGAGTDAGGGAAPDTIAEATVALAPADEVSAADPWFVRVAGYPGIGAALAWDRAVAASAAAPVRRSYRLLVADGRLPDAEIATLLTP
ncbi:MAG: PmoA family protein [Microbacterium arborescens]